MKTNTLLVVACAAATLLTGCATSVQRMDIDDLNHMKPDCANKEAQIKFLESQIPTQNERMAAVFTTNIISEFAAALKGKKSEETLIMDRSYDSAAKGLIWYLRTNCKNKIPSDYAALNNGTHNLNAR
jgi:hypothetical protein